MRSSRLRQILHGLFVLASVSTVTGCATIGGNVANSSGMGYYQQGNYAAAAGEFQNALATDPGNPDYLANLAKSRMKMGDSAGAEQLFRQALTTAPSHQPAYHGLAELMLDQGRTQEAQAMLTTWSGSQPYIAESHVELAWLQGELGNPQAAVQSLQQALQVNPSHATALAQMGQYYEEMGQTDQAVAMYQDSLRSDWNQPEVHSRIAAASQKAGGSSPMAATAMARGVHPYAVPRQQTAFGPPSPGAQMAQMQMAQTQMAMAGNPMYGQAMPGMMPNQMAIAPNVTQGMMQSNYAPDWQPSPSYGPSMPTQTAAFGPQTPMMNQWSEGTESVVPPFAPQPAPSQGSAVAPTPDPAFSIAPAKAPVKAVSFDPASDFDAFSSPETATASNELPLVDAF